MSATADHLERFLNRLRLLGQGEVDPWLAMPVTDPLTGLPNRKAIVGLAERELRRGSILTLKLRRRSSSLTLLVFDVDHFKKLNERYLLPGGDAVLRQLGSRLAATVLPGEYVGRFGGDRFLVVVAEANAQQAAAVAERLRNAVQEAAFTYKGVPIRITITVGVGVAELGESWAGMTLGCPVEGGVSDALQPLIRCATDDMERAKKVRSG
jgi:diguanylate cyclase (GGDEF)-like protein